MDVRTRALTKIAAGSVVAPVQQARQPPKEDQIAANINKGIGMAAPFIAKHEGFRQKAYYDNIGNKWTVGHGHTYIMDPKTGKNRSVMEGDVMDEKTSLGLINKRLRENAYQLSKNHKWTRGLSPGSLAAMYDVAYNAGIGVFSNSKSPGLNKDVLAPNANLDEVVKRHVPTYRFSGGKQIRGLANRRNDAVREFFEA